VNNKNVIALPASTNFKPEQALHSALSFGDDLTDVLVVGFESGALLVRSSHMTRAEALFMLEKAKEWVMSGGL
jgi:hypothetical protein